MEAQDLGLAAGPVDDPMRLAEDGDDMAALDCFEGGDRGISCRDGGAGGQLGVDLEVEGGAGREDDGASIASARRGGAWPGSPGQLADLVEEQGAAVGQLEAADPPGDAPVKAPFSWPNSSLSTSRRAGRRS